MQAEDTTTPLNATDPGHLETLYATLARSSFYHTTTISDYELASVMVHATAATMRFTSGVLQRGLAWPRKSTFAFIDTARAMLLHPEGAGKVLAAGILDTVLALGAPDGQAPMCVGLALKFCANLVCSDPGFQFIQSNPNVLPTILQFVAACASVSVRDVT